MPRSTRKLSVLRQAETGLDFRGKRRLSWRSNAFMGFFEAVTTTTPKLATLSAGRLPPWAAPRGWTGLRKESRSLCRRGCRGCRGKDRWKGEVCWQSRAEPGSLTERRAGSPSSGDQGEGMGDSFPGSAQRAPKTRCSEEGKRRCQMDRSLSYFEKSSS